MFSRCCLEPFDLNVSSLVIPTHTLVLKGEDGGVDPGIVGTAPRRSKRDLERSWINLIRYKGGIDGAHTSWNAPHFLRVPCRALAVGVHFRPFTSYPSLMSNLCMETRWQSYPRTPGSAWRCPQSLLRKEPLKSESSRELVEGAALTERGGIPIVSENSARKLSSEEPGRRESLSRSDVFHASHVNDPGG